MTIRSDNVTEGDEYLAITLVPSDSIAIYGSSTITLIIGDRGDDLCTPTPCHPEAVCTVANNGTNASCVCLPPYEGDGFNCRPFDPCDPSPCHPNATCTLGMSGSGSVRSRSDYEFSGFGSSSGSGSGMESGRGPHEATCTCDPPLLGDGRALCVPDPCDPSPCDQNAVCQRVYAGGSSVDFNCSCRETFVGDGLTCSREYTDEGCPLNT